MATKDTDTDYAELKSSEPLKSVSAVPSSSLTKDNDKDREFTMEEVAQHARSGALWLAIHGKVYNVTEFIKTHPGGADALRGSAGLDATLDFEGVGHDNYARKLMIKYKIGRIKGYKPPGPFTLSKEEQAKKKHQSTINFMVAAWVVIAGIAFAAMKFLKLD